MDLFSFLFFFFPQKQGNGKQWFYEYATFAGSAKKKEREGTNGEVQKLVHLAK